MEKKPRLLFVTEAFGGGVFEYCLLLCNELASHFEVYLAYGVRPQTPEGFREMFDPRIHLIPVEHFVRSIRLGDDIRAGRELVRIYREVKPDLVHLHSSKAGAIGRIAFAFKKTPLFYTPHGYSFLMTNAGKLRRQVYFAMEYALARIPCTTVCCSAGEYRQALRLTRRARQINNAVNLQDIDAFLRENPPARHPFTVCTVGRICQQKNPALANRIAQRMPDVRFVWVGDGELRSQLTAPNLEVTGWVKREEALRTMEQADVMLLRLGSKLAGGVLPDIHPFAALVFIGVQADLFQPAGRLQRGLITGGKGFRIPRRSKNCTHKRFLFLIRRMGSSTP